MALNKVAARINNCNNFREMSLVMPSTKNGSAPLSKMSNGAYNLTHYRRKTHKRVRWEDPDEMQPNAAFHHGLHSLLRLKQHSGTELHRRLGKYTCDHLPGRVAQSVTCLATDACLTADPGVASSIPARSHTFVEIDHEIISTVILLPSADSFKKSCCQLQAKVCAQITG